MAARLLTRHSADSSLPGSRVQRAALRPVSLFRSNPYRGNPTRAWLSGPWRLGNGPGRRDSGLCGGGDGDVDSEDLKPAEVGANLAVAVSLAFVPVGAEVGEPASGLVARPRRDSSQRVPSDGLLTIAKRRCRASPGVTRSRSPRTAAHTTRIPRPGRAASDAAADAGSRAACKGRASSSAGARTDLRWCRPEAITRNNG